ncbi:MAG TPA: hypothetical protein VIX19_18650 [Terriglobales bacterium]
MMRAAHSERTRCQPRFVEDRNGQAFALTVSKSALIVLVVIVVLAPRPALGQTGAFSLLASPGGITGTLVGTDYVNTFGNMNGLGIGAPNAGLTVSALSNGALYFSQYQVQFSSLPAGHTATLTAYVSTNFTHPAAQVVENCPNTSACTSSAGYSAMSTSAAAQTAVVASMGNGTTTVGIGVFIPDNDGASAFTGADGAAVINFTMTDLSTRKVLATATWTFNGAPAQTVQDAVQLTLATAPGGLSVAAAADYSMAFGNVNGLGIGPGAGLTMVAAAGGVIYSTPYLLNPAYTDFTSTTATISVYVSTNFAHPAILKMEDSGASAGPYATISTTAGVPTQITSAAADRASITRYLGMFVGLNNAPAFLGSDNATLTFTMTVP